MVNSQKFNLKLHVSKTFEGVAGHFYLEKLLIQKRNIYLLTFWYTMLGDI